MDILLIGNGFDLAHKLPTTYTDFLMFLKRIHPAAITLPRFNIKLEPLIRDPENKDILKEMNALFVGNVWYDYFSQKTTTNENWCDFESEIEYIVNQLETTKNHLDKYRQLTLDAKDFPFSDTLFFSISILNYLKKANIQMNLTDVLDLSIRQNYLIFKGKRHHIKLTIGNGKPVFTFDVPPAHKLIDIAFENLLDFILEHLKEFTKCFELYLFAFVDKLYYHKIIFIDHLLHIPALKLLTFNYTTTFRRYTDTILEKKETCFIHGQACKNQNENLVLGIDEKSKNIDPMFTNFRKYFQRAYKNCETSFRQWITDIKSFPNIKHNLYIIGHSLTTSDRSILNEFITLNNMTTTIYYHSEDSRKSLMQNLAAILGHEKFAYLMETQSIKFEQGDFIRFIHEMN